MASATFSLIALLIPLAAGVLVAQDAKKRKMNPWGWGIGVFLLLIVFLPLYFILRKPVQSDGDILDM